VKCPKGSPEGKTSKFQRRGRREEGQAETRRKRKTGEGEEAQ